MRVYTASRTELSTQSQWLMTHNHVFCDDTAEHSQSPQLPAHCNSQLGASKVGYLLFFILLLSNHLHRWYDLLICYRKKSLGLIFSTNVSQIRAIHFIETHLLSDRTSDFLISCTFHSEFSRTAASDGNSSVREARSVGDLVVVQPVDCVLSEWSRWSRCDTCTKKKVRQY